VVALTAASVHGQRRSMAPSAFDWTTPALDRCGRRSNASTTTGALSAARRNYLRQLAIGCDVTIIDLWTGRWAHLYLGSGHPTSPPKQASDDHFGWGSTTWVTLATVPRHVPTSLAWLGACRIPMHFNNRYNLSTKFVVAVHSQRAGTRLENGGLG
jgi:hypothetical protein